MPGKQLRVAGVADVGGAYAEAVVVLAKFGCLYPGSPLALMMTDPA
jgi:hypothetical protein